MKIKDLADGTLINLPFDSKFAVRRRGLIRQTVDGDHRREILFYLLLQKAIAIEFEAQFTTMSRRRICLIIHTPPATAISKPLGSGRKFKDDTD